MSTTTPTTITTTTTGTTTTTPPSSMKCNKDVVISHGSLDYWSTPNFPQDYPEGVTCTLTVTIPKSLQSGFAEIKVVEGGIIFKTKDCQHDVLLEDSRKRSGVFSPRTTPLRRRRLCSLLQTKMVQLRKASNYPSQESILSANVQELTPSCVSANCLSDYLRNRTLWLEYCAR
ncbi:hypothetical protein Hamer_G007685 [Homarus americanus]|uniref:CUB domain-containing protein n=1 Tax=Homarus americanus TaxID=6706 RepID=A0A8J5MRH4_HOMAM|nr:hypothetical protein Hamer_G007685 [Homarus americanus]